jgi:hypothetical protein
MAQKPKARSAKKKAVPKKKAPDEKQFERFLQTARDLGADESGEEFEKAFSKISRRQNLSGRKAT